MVISSSCFFPTESDKMNQLKRVLSVTIRVINMMGSGGKQHLHNHIKVLEMMLKEELGVVITFARGYTL